MCPAASAQAIGRNPNDTIAAALHNSVMLNLQALTAQDLVGLSPDAAAEVLTNLLAHIRSLANQVAEQAQTIKFKDVKLERITFEMARLKRARFGAKTERMDAQQRQMFEEAMDADQASLEAQLEALQGKPAAPSAPPALDPGPRRPKRQALPENLPRTVHIHEPDNTNCNCGLPMVRIGEDVSEKLDIVPTQFFVHRHVRGKWACKCCQALVQEPVDPQIIDKGMPAEGLLAHLLVSRFVDHIPYYRQEQINARAGVHTPRSTLASWSGRAGAALLPLYEVWRDFVLSARVLHADETPVSLLDPGAGKTKKAYVWAYARGAFDDQPGVVYDFCAGRGAKYPAAFLQGWSGTLVCDDFKGYDAVLKLEQRIEAGCTAHSRRKFEELVKDNASEVAAQAMQRIARLYQVEREARSMAEQDRQVVRKNRAKPLCDEMRVWLMLERQRVPDGSAIARAIDYSLNRWGPLTAYLDDGGVPIDNNHVENLMRPWAMGRKAWLFAGSEMAGQRAAMVMSLVQSAKLNGHEPFEYLKDVLRRLPMHPNNSISDLLPHCWKPSA